MMSSSNKTIGQLRVKYLSDMRQALKAAYVGKSVSAIPTPSLVIHADAANKNKATLEAMVLRFRERRSTEDKTSAPTQRHTLRIRPHAKLHKSRELARRVLGGDNAHLYAGVCVQKVSEAEVLSGYFDTEVSDENYRIRNIFISNEIGTFDAAARVVALHQWMCEQNTLEERTIEGRSASSYKLAVCVDSVAGVKMLKAAFENINHSPQTAPLALFVEVDIGQHRGGAVPTEEGLMPLLMSLTASSSFFTLEGLHAYHGGAQHIRNPTDRAEVMRASIAHTTQAQSVIESYLGSVGGDQKLITLFTTVTGAGTGTFSVAEGPMLSSPYNELQPGSYYVMDRDYLSNDNISTIANTDDSAFIPAMYIKSSVVSKTVISADEAPHTSTSPNLSRIIVNGGHKSSAIDSGLPCLAPWQARQLMEGNAVDASWASEYLIECANGGDDHGGFGAHMLNFVRIGGDSASSACPPQLATQEAKSAVGTTLLSKLSLGDTVWLIPGHCDPTFNLHDYYFIVSGDDVNNAIIEDIGMVDARGCQQ